MEYINNLKNKIDNSNIIDNSFIYDCWKSFDASTKSCSAVGRSAMGVGVSVSQKERFALDILYGK